MSDGEERVQTVMKNLKSVLITGGAGFIGSHIVDAFMSRGAEVHVLDDLSSGSEANVKPWVGSRNFALVNCDLSKASGLKKLRDGYEAVFHFAANPEVRVGVTSPDVHFRQNVVATHNLLEHLRKTGKDTTIAFASTSTVYGEPDEMPTPEDYSPLKPISVYGATKLACESLISAYSHTYGFRAVIYRLANVTGPRSRHGVVHDFIQKLRKNPRKLEILGDGTQTKSYLYVGDCVKAVLLGAEKSSSRFETYNVGSDDQINVKDIADIVVKAMGLRGVRFTLTGGVDGGRGWGGDVKNMLLDTGKIKALGWRATLNSEQAVAETARQLLETPQSQL
jgi:UDP-glucose 4-epimerase